MAVAPLINCSTRTDTTRDPGAGPLISVIVPVYNRLQYLDRAIRSVLAQSHPSVEVLVIDDGSPLDPAPVAAKYDERVRLYRKANGGLASARNWGIVRARGDYLLFLDDDDFLEPTALADLLACLAGTPDAVWAAGRFSYVDADGNRLSREHGCELSSGNVYRRMIANNLMGAPSVVLVSTSAVRELGGFDQTPCYHMAEDWDLWISLARCSPLAATSNRVTNYRLHGSQFTHQQRPKHLLAMIAVMEKQASLDGGENAEEFAHVLARLRMNLGDLFYLAGQHAQARTHWRSAKAGGALSSADLWPRMAKSLLPPRVLAVLRGVKQRQTLKRVAIY